MIEQRSYVEEYSGVDGLIAEIIAGETDDRDIFRVFYRTISERIEPPVDAFVIAVPITVTELLYDNNQRVGLRSRCRRDNGEFHLVAFQECPVSLGF